VTTETQRYIADAKAAHDTCESNPDNLSFEECTNPKCVEANRLLREGK